MWITEAVDNEYYEARAESHGTEYRSRFAITGDGDGHRLAMTFAARPRSLGAKVMSVLLGWMFKGATEKALRQAGMTPRTFERAEHLLDTGAQGIDIGGQGSTDNASVVSWQDEWDRLRELVPALAALGIPVSVDSWRPEVMRLGLEHGADVINGADGMQDDEMWKIAAEFEVPVVVPFLSGPNPREMVHVTTDPLDALRDFSGIADGCEHVADRHTASGCRRSITAASGNSAAAADAATDFGTTAASETQSPPRVIDLIRQFAPHFLSGSGNLAFQVRSVLSKLMLCRTKTLGGHTYVCPPCGTSCQIYNSCGDRHCPLCAGARRADWMEKTRELILPGINYFQVIFTLPGELSGLILGNRQALYDLLFQSAWRALDETLRAAGQFQPAAQLVLHT